MRLCLYYWGGERITTQSEQVDRCIHHTDTPELRKAGYPKGGCVIGWDVQCAGTPDSAYPQCGGHYIPQKNMDRVTSPPHFFGVVWQRTKDRNCFVTVPARRQDDFPLAATVCISLADEPGVRMQSVVRDKGGGVRYAKIMRRGQAALADHFADGAAVRVELVEAEP